MYCDAEFLLRITILSIILVLPSPQSPRKKFSAKECESSSRGVRREKTSPASATAVSVPFFSASPTVISSVVSALQALDVSSSPADEAMVVSSEYKVTPFLPSPAVTVETQGNVTSGSSEAMSNPPSSSVSVGVPITVLSLHHLSDCVATRKFCLDPATQLIPGTHQVPRVPLYAPVAMWYITPHFAVWEVMTALDELALRLVDTISSVPELILSKFQLDPPFHDC